MLSGEITAVEDRVVRATVESDGIPEGVVLLLLYVIEPVETGGNARVKVGTAKPEIVPETEQEVVIEINEHAPDFEKDDLIFVWDGKKAPRGGVILNWEEQIE